MSVLKVGAIQPNSGTKVNITGSTLLVTTASGHFSGSYEGDGSRLSGVAGFPFTGSGTVSGSLLVTGSSTLALRVSGSSAFTGSLFVSGTVSGSFTGDGSNLTGIATTLTVDGDSGTQDVDLTTDDLQILGTTNEIVTAITKVGNDVKATIGLPDSITVTASIADTATTSSHARTGDGIFSGSFSGSYEGDGSSLTGVGGFPHTGSADITGSLIVTGSAFVTSLTETSALRYKKYVKDIGTQASSIYELRPVHFRWRDTNKKDYGLIAEEVQKVYPELVTSGEDGNALGISYTKLTALLLKTIQDLNERIENLENKN